QSLWDVAPRLRLKPRNASWSAGERLWITSEKVMEIVTSVEGPTAEAFSKEPGRLMVFVDQKNVQNVTAAHAAPVLRVPITKLKSGLHRITVDWVSDYGPVAVNSMLFRVERAGASKTASR